ncbi:hypothetical protein RCS94_01940 [Orbaceae bacterium ac157xtp]
MLIVPSTYGVLSATSVNTIRGNTPTFTGKSGANKLGFKVGGTTYSQGLGNIDSNTIKEFNAGLKLSDFIVTSLTVSDFSPANDYADADGDTAHPTTPFEMGARIFEWIDSNNRVIPIAKYNQTLGCGSGLNLPLTLKITLPNVKVRSRYGHPNESTPTDLVKMYKIGTATGICFAKPGSLYWYNGFSDSPNRNPTQGGGYNSLHFDPANGFKVSANPKFPTTGFPKAYFYLIMTSNASDYTFTSNAEPAVTVGSDGKVTLNSKPSGAVTITAVFKSDTSKVHRYMFDPRSVWVVPKLNPTASDRYTYANAKTACGGVNKVPTRAHLTNSPLNNLAVGGTIVSNYYTRAIGGGIFGEWGETSSINYFGSNWARDYYWTRDQWSSSSQFYVSSTYGYIYYYPASYSAFLACLE